MSLHRALGPWSLLPVVLLAASTPADVADAATVRVDRKGIGCPAVCGSVESFVYRAAAGEPNRTTVSRDGSGDFRFVDFGATVRAGAGCESTSPHEVVCHEASDYAPGVFVFAADGSDQLTSTLP